MTDWIKARWYGASIMACVFCLMIGCATAIIVGRTAPPVWIVFGGNGDTGNGQGAGWFEGELQRVGWTDNAFQVTYPADVGSMAESTDQAMGPGIAAYNELCSNQHCIIAGFSQGADAAIALAHSVGHPSGKVYLFGGPQASTGLWHHPVPDHPLVSFWLNSFGLPTEREPSAGMNFYYSTRDPYANPAPQCAGPGLYALDAGQHVVVPPSVATHNWVGPDGVNMYEMNYVAPPGLPFSGSDYPPEVWQGCPPGWGE